MNRGIWLIDEDDIARLIKLPKGQRVIGVHGDWQCMSIQVGMDGEGLPEVAPGTEAPIIGRGIPLLDGPKSDGFPLDETTLRMVDMALDSGPSGVSSLGAFLELTSQLAGADTAAVESDDLGVTVLRDPQYSEHDMIRALVAEVRRLRRLVP